MSATLSIREEIVVHALEMLHAQLDYIMIKETVSLALLIVPLANLKMFVRLVLKDSKLNQ